MTDWSKVRYFVHKRALFCTVAVLDEGRIRLFPIGSVRIHEDGCCTYFELFAKPVQSGAEIAMLAVDVSPWFWLTSLLRGRFSHPPALRLEGVVGQRRECTEQERQGWFRRVGWLLKTKGGRLLWQHPSRIREVRLQSARPVRVGRMSQDSTDWVV